MEKKCFKCQEIKHLSEFYKHSEMADGHLNKCKQCTKKDVRRDRATSENARTYDRNRYHNNPDRRIHIYVNAGMWKDNNPDAYKAHNILNNAVRDGKINKQPCEDCGSTENLHAHHDDYDKPLEVKWKCAKHHAAYLTKPF